MLQRRACYGFRVIPEAQILAGKILIVDDQAPGILLLERTLASAGYTQVISTREPRDVCELHKANRFDLILLDLQMPHMDGFAVLAELRQIDVDGYLSVLAVTASSAEWRLRALRSGARDFVSKPFDLAEVLMRVHNLIEVRLLQKMARAQVKELEALALQDPLTGLANRRLATERMFIALAHGRRNASAMAVIYLDLDGFKSVNDTWGHGVGDLLLKTVAERLVGTVREEDTVARLGGDEFMISLWHVVDQAAAEVVAHKVIEVLSQPYQLDGHEVRVTASAGIALFPAAGEDTETLMKHADQALYAAKKAGKNAAHVFKG